MTFRWILARHLGRNLLCGFLIATSFLGVRVVVGDTAMEYAAQPHVTGPAIENRVELLLDRGACWTGNAPADMEGVLPGHVVVTVHGVARVGGDRLVGLALEQLFEGADHGMVVHGFCR